MVKPTKYLLDFAPGRDYPTEELLEDDVLFYEGSSELIAYHEHIYKILISYPTWVQCTKTPNKFELYWGPDGNTYFQESKNGRIKFMDILHLFDKEGYYLKTLGKEYIQLVEETYPGKSMSEVEGQKVGEKYGLTYNDNVKVGPEKGDLNGYFPHNRGQAKMYAAIYASLAGEKKVAKIVLRGEDGNTHFYDLKPNFKAEDLQHESDERYLLDKGCEIKEEIVQIITADGIELKRSETPISGWSCKKTDNELTVWDQFLFGAIIGDAFEDPTVTSTISQIFVGLIPGVGLSADGRDVAIGIQKIWTSGGDDGKMQTLFALVGFVPGFGDAVKSAWKAGGKKALKETLVEMTPTIEKSLVKALKENSNEVASFVPGLMINKKLSDMFGKTKVGDAETIKDSIEKFAKEMNEQYEALGKNPMTLVSVTGRKWDELAKVLNNDKLGRELGEKMQKWRVKQFEDLKPDVNKEVNRLNTKISGSGGKKLAIPDLPKTGTPAFTSDIDCSFLGKDATHHRNMAIRLMEEKHGIPWQKSYKHPNGPFLKDLLDADIFSDPRRLHMFDTLSDGARNKIEKEMVKESQLNVLAKMNRDGVDELLIENYMKKFKVDKSDLDKRIKQIADLDPSKGPQEALSFRKNELKMDVLHSKFETATGKEKEKIAEEMAKLQGKLNAAIDGPYITPGGAALHVTRRDNIGNIKMTEFKPLSPAMGYTAALDNLYMYEHVIQKVMKGELKELDQKTAKEMVKYADRLLIIAGQHGVDIGGNSKLWKLYTNIENLLWEARIDPAKMFEKGTKDLKDVRGMLDKNIDEFIEAVQKNADDKIKSTLINIFELLGQLVQILKRPDVRGANIAGRNLKRHEENENK